jgi:sensor histidine kinase YesM
MNPTATRRSRIGIYRLASLPLPILLIVLIGVQGVSWQGLAVISLPLALTAQFIAMSAWYMCRTAPLRRSSVVNLIFRHAVAAFILSALWTSLASATAIALSRIDYFRGFSGQFAPHTPTIFWTGAVFYLMAVAFHYVLLAHEASQEAEERALQTAMLARDAELRALRAQINPHFLYNSLNSISALTSIDPAKAREMCVLLADFLRMTLGLSANVSIALEGEIELLERYLAIEKIRFGARLAVETEIEPQARKCLLPPLLLQPLVENAVVHGIANRPEGGTVRLAARCNNGHLSIAIDNSFDPEAGAGKRAGVGLKNVRERLEARFGKEASAQTTREGGRFCVSLLMPAVMAADKT